MNGSTSRDPGLQAERTGLAWQRTALSVAAGSIAAARISYEDVGRLALLNVAIALPLALWVYVGSRLRPQHRPTRQPAARWHVPLDRWRPGVGVEGAVLGAAVLVLGTVELVAVLSAGS